MQTDPESGRSGVTLAGVMLYGKRYGGADPQLIEGDNFRMIISVPEFSENPVKTAKIIPTDRVAGEVAGEVARLLSAVSGEMKRTEMQAQLGLKHQDHFRDAYLVPALGAGLMEMTIPSKPNSRLQKYRLTPKGHAILNQLKQENAWTKRSS